VNNFNQIVNNISRNITVILKHRQILPIRYGGSRHCLTPGPWTALHLKLIHNLKPNDMTGWHGCRRLMGAICTLIGVGLFAQEVSAKTEHGYLPAVGPAPLRYQMVTTNLYVFDPEFFAPKIKPAGTNSAGTATLAAEAATNDTPPMPVPHPTPPVVLQAVSTPVQPVTTAPSAGYDPNNPLGNFNPNFPSPSASVMLPVSSQMITDYLKPEPNGKYNGNTSTNSFDQPGATVFVPAQLQFTPPTPSVGGASSATYRSQ